MGGRSRLRGGLERVLPDHRSALEQALRREYRALLDGLAIDGDPLLGREASRVAFLAIRAQESARAWGEVIEKRRTGRGRRPSPRAVERAARRAALDDQTATQALDRLRELAGRNGRHAGLSLKEVAALLDGRLRRPHV
jgi:hypothetical protein